MEKEYVLTYWWKGCYRQTIAVIANNKKEAVEKVKAFINRNIKRNGGIKQYTAVEFTKLIVRFGLVETPILGIDDE